MATLVLSTVGTLLGGPVGGVIGSLLGQSIDQQLFGPGPREGPRIGDLSVQTSNYGTPLPLIFGTMRVAGSIIWSTDLEEASQTQGAKGQPEAVTYSYSVSFAIALSSRRIGNIRRIWADGKLIRTADGDFTVGTGFRFHDGSEEQPIDPLIASIEGIDSAPAYRGLAIAIFEHLQLAEFGNRIPFLTFEVEADPGSVPLGLVLDEVSEGAIASNSPSALSGYAAYGSTMASAVEPLVDIFGVPLFDDGKILASPTTTTLNTTIEELGCTAESEPAPRYERSQSSMRSLPGALSLRYQDPDREYQAGSARAAIDNVAARDETVELPAVLRASAAKALAETSLARRWAERDKLTIRVPPAYLAVRPGTLFEIGEDRSLWKAERITINSMIAVAELRPIYSTIASVPADPGRVLPALGVEPAPTTVEVIELPDDGSGRSDTPVVAVAASASGGLGRPVPLQVNVGGRESGTRVVAAQSVMGTATTALPPAPFSLFDLLNSVEVELVDPNAWLESRDDIAVSDRSNLALIGQELIQFGEAIPIGQSRFRLNKLLRGRRGTEWAISLHGAGERFVLVEPARLHRIPLSTADVGTTVRAIPRGLADSSTAPAEALVSGEAMRPPSPAHLRASVDASGMLSCSWVRRSRRGWAWLDGVDAPLDCSVERYRVNVRNSLASIDVETGEPKAEFSNSELASLGDGPVEVRVTQVGDLAVSRQTSVIVNLS